jgi:hypothetical protein
MRGELPEGQRCSKTYVCGKCRTEDFEPSECEVCGNPMQPWWRVK